MIQVTKDILNVAQKANLPPDEFGEVLIALVTAHIHTYARGDVLEAIRGADCFRSDVVERLRQLESMSH